jgi:arsenate reductase (glutaredoxin)
MTQPTLYGIATCDTVKRARAWFDAGGIDYRFVDFKKSGLEPARLARWVDALGWEALLNRRGTTWRKLPAEQQAAVIDAASAQALMLDQLSVIKRPVVEWADGRVTVGYDAAQFTASGSS